MKKIILVLFAAMAMFACSNSEEGSTVTVADFEEKAADLVDQKVQIEGMVVHVCRHGGGKMFLEEVGNDKRVKITAGEGVGQFDQSWETEGKEVLVEGFVREMKIDEAYLANWEAELKEKASEEKAQGGNEAGCDGEKEETPEKDGKDCDEETKTSEAKADTCETETEHAEHTEDHPEDVDKEEHHEDGFAQIEELRKQLKDSGKDHLSFYSIECTKYELKEK